MSVPDAAVGNEEEGNFAEVQRIKKRKLQEVPDTLDAPEYGPAPRPPTHQLEAVPVIVEDNIDENSHKYVGLVNQAMTCYLNSLIQSLYMTPEFRNAIYRYELEEEHQGSTAKNIPYQLQKLFLLLQTSENGSLETTDLTKSFGWDQNEAYEQHDVQELYKIMFNVLQNRFKKSENHRGIIDQLYCGKMQDFVKCLKCGRENVKSDIFTDLPLAVREFGATEAFKSVQEALHAFVRQELLTDRNKYACEACDSLQDGLKGLRMTEFPYLLAIQLKRFDYDYSLGHRVKLNERVSFPDLLDLNDFIYNPESLNGYPPSKMSYSNAVKNSIVEDGEDDEEAGNEVNLTLAQRMLERGPNVYELYSIMVHQGSTTGGHYFAYVKNMDQQKWFCFNDASVTSASPSDIKSSFGGSTGGWSVSNTNAYMLMYRRFDPERNSRFMRTSELPSYLCELRKKWEQEEEERLKAKAYQDSLVTVHIQYNDCLDIAPLIQSIPNDTSLSLIFSSALAHFGQFCDFRSLDCRLLLCVNQNTIQMALDALQINTLVLKDLDTWNPPGFITHRTDHYFMIDVKPPRVDTFYPIVENEGHTVLVEEIDLETGMFSGKRVWFGKYETVRAMKAKLKAMNAKYDADDVERIRIVLERNPDFACESMTLLDDNDMIFESIMAYCYGDIVLYADTGCNSIRSRTDRDQIFIDSIFFQHLERKKFGMSLRIKVPSLADYQQAGFLAPFHISSGKLSDYNNIMAVLPNNDSLNDHLLTSTSTTEAVLNATNVAAHHGYVGEVDSISTSNSVNPSPTMSPRVSEMDEEHVDSDMLTLDTGTSTQEDMEQSDNDVFQRPLDVGRSNKFVTINENDELVIPPDYTRCATPRMCDDAALASTSNALTRHPIRILASDDIGQEIVLAVDQRHLMKNVFEWLSAYLAVDMGQFTMVKHYERGDNGYESSYSPFTTVKEGCQTAHSLSVKLRTPLKENEKLIRVMSFELNEHKQENWKFLFEIPSSSDTKIRDFLVKCQIALKNQLGEFHPLERLRLRDLTTNGVPVLRKDFTFAVRGVLWSKNVYLQILDEDKPDANEGDVVMVRRWRPEQLEVSATKELLVTGTHKDLSLELRSKISRMSKIPEERVEISELIPTSAWTKWPYEKSIIDLCDHVRFHSSLNIPKDVLNGKVVYYKDSAEVRAPLTEDERRNLREKENSAKPEASTMRRKERPLRIQMSSSISEA
ncbi:hypothetical protein QR680_001407 [Steinernema hermaphroditum]|uniref:Ubiquitin carboxyl-terminal hydrolase 47 n=1 Tax=Steinernema hermaphroditum TaxID=289476 RepID=A0AA39GY53_9BILA|nr:hypothetical protein QR680_001407 [Steinernema hermaphroditum]